MYALRSPVYLSASMVAEFCKLLLQLLAWLRMSAPSSAKSLSPCMRGLHSLFPA